VKLGIVGAGMAGLSCAEAAIRAGHEVTLFDKGRGAGGRLSTRRTSTSSGDLRFDHGTMTFNARSDAFKMAVADWRDRGLVSEWTANMARFSSGAPRSFSDETHYVGAPAMNTLIKGLAIEKTVHFGWRVNRLQQSSAGWTLHFQEQPETFDCDALVLAIPNEQAVELLASVWPDFAQKAASCVSVPIWSVMLGYETALQLEFDLAEVTGSPIRKISRNQRKPGRDPSGECLVIQASPDWSVAHVEDEPEDVTKALEQACFDLLGAAPSAPLSRQAHRWRYALNATPYGKPFVLNEALHLGVCGDWLLGDRVEDAWSSGRALGEIL